MSLAPIAVFAYNRPDHFRRVTEALARNPEASASRLFVYSDAPKNAAAAEGVAQVRSHAHGIKGFGSVEVIEHRSNQGVARSIINGVTDLAATFGKVVVLEDDLLPSPHFLAYMNDALDSYEHDDRVISVHAYSYPVSSVLPETFFLRGADCWGWATWKRGWDIFEADGRKLLRELEHRKLSYDFDFNGSYPYTQMLRDCIDGKNDSWAIRWYASAFLLGKLTLYPASSQVQNIGADGSGLHVGATRSFEHRQWGKRIAVGKIPVEESNASRRAFAAYLSGLRPSPVKRVLNRIANLFEGKA
jgi:hypothetical protein